MENSGTDRAVATFLMLVAAVCGLLAASALARDFELASIVWACLLSAAGICLFLGAKSDRRYGIALTVFTVGICGLLIDALLYTLIFLSDSNRERMQAADAIGEPFDQRTRQELFEALSANGSDVSFHTLPIKNALDPELLDDWGFSPLGHMSNHLIIGSNETGQYLTYISDEYGFRNPPGTLDTPQLDALLVGDSFAEGLNVADSLDTASQLRLRGLTVASVGIGGNGPLSALGAMKEYGAQASPQHVFWFYYEDNDLADLSQEQTSAILMSYLEPGYLQNLRGSQALIDKTLISHMQNKVKEENSRWSSIKKNTFLRILRGYHLRNSFSNLRLQGLERDQTYPIELFETALKRAKANVTSWGGTLTFVYLPSWSRLSGEDRALVPLKHREDVMEAVRRLELPVVDYAVIAANHESPLDLFAFGLPDHYNATGYALLADALDSHIKRYSVAE